MGLSVEEKERRKLARHMEYYNRTHKEVSGIIYKICPKCEEWFIESKDNFYYQNGKSGTNCKRCEIKKSDKRMREHHDEHLVIVNNWRRSHMEYKAEHCRKRVANGKAGKWQQDNPDKIKQYRLKREENKTHTISKKEWKDCQEYFNNSCAYCGLPIEEHFTTYRGITKQGNFQKEHVDHEGANDLSNCVPSCKTCNSSKHNIDFEEWYQQQTFYSEERLDIIYKWLSEDYKKYIVEKIELPYIVKKVRDTEGIIIYYELWSKDEEGEPLECLGNGKLKSDLKVYIEKYII